MTVQVFQPEQVDPKDIERFWAKVNRADPDSCWEWSVRQSGGRGYGMTYARINGEVRQMTAHRLAWLISGHPLHSDLLIAHHCDNPRCCNPSHLFEATHAENMRDMIRKGRRGQTSTTRNPATLIAKVYDLLDVGMPKRQISRETGVPLPTIRRYAKHYTPVHGATSK